MATASAFLPENWRRFKPAIWDTPVPRALLLSTLSLPIGWTYLWLIVRSETAKENLRREAESLGVASHRLKYTHQELHVIDIILPYYRKDLYRNCICSICDNTDPKQFNIILIDDSNGTLGPIRAYNQGMRKSENDVVLINDDITV